MNYFKNAKKFHIISHSFSTFLALKIAEKLESLGKTGHISSIDGSPSFIKKLVMLQFKTEDVIQNLLVVLICSNIFTILDETFIKEVLAYKTWEEKVEKLTSLDQNVYGKEYLKLMANALFNRVKTVFNSETLKISKLKSTSMLIRPNSASLTNIDEAYDLDENFKKKVKVTFLDGNHFSILENPSLIELLNLLHSELIN